MPRLPDRIRRVLRGRLHARSRGVPHPGERREARERDGMGEMASEFTMDELHEFLKGDLRPPNANPVFKEQLRDEMWDLVREVYGATKDEEEG